MGEENTDIRGETITAEIESAVQEAPFDRLEARIDALIERFEVLQSEHSNCGDALAAKEERIHQLEDKLENMEKQRSEIRSRLDRLIDKLSRIS